MAYNQKMTKRRAERHIRAFGFILNAADDGNISLDDKLYHEIEKEYTYVKDTLCNSTPCTPQRKQSFSKVQFNDPSQRQSELERKSAQQRHHERN